MMTRKHFRKIAEILANNNVHDNVIDEFCFFLKDMNPLFDEDKFREYIEKNKKQYKIISAHEKKKRK